MHQTGMFSGARQQQAPQIEVYDIQQISQPFMTWNFGIGQPYDEMTPNVCLMTINEIQQQALRGHPLRVGMFNIMSQNAFNNGLFQDLVYTILMRMGHGISAGEWRNFQMAAQTTIPRAVKCCGSAMAAEDPEFMGALQQNEQAAVRENAEIWNYLMALAQGQAQYVSFNDMGGTGLGAVSGSTQDALRDARALRGQGAGNFQEGVTHFEGMPTGRYGNNGGQRVGRYGRRSEMIHGKLEGSMQSALNQMGQGQQQEGGQQLGGDANYQSRMRNRPNPVPQATPQGRAAAAQFDSDVTDFSKPMETKEIFGDIFDPMKQRAAAPTPAPAPEAPKEPLFQVQMDGNHVKIMRELPDGVKAWKPSKLQRFHPAWCKRTHRVRYFETSDKEVIALLQNLTEEEKEKNMNYEAHAIDPSKGQPEPDAIQKPVREEAKVLYAAATDVKVNVIIAPNFSAEEDVSGAVRSTRLAAEMSEQVPQAYAKTSLINVPIVYATAEEAADDVIVIKAIGGAKDFVEAAGYISKIRNDLARKSVDDTLVEAINRACGSELGIPIVIENFAEDGPAIIDAVEKHFGSLPAEKLRAHQTTLLAGNVMVRPATGMKDYADATLAVETAELPEPMLKRVVFLQRNITVVWVNYTDDELGIGMPEKGAATIQADSLGGLHQIAESVFTNAVGTQSMSEQFLVTKDNVRYRLHRGLINRNIFLLSADLGTKAGK